MPSLQKKLLNHSNNFMFREVFPNRWFVWTLSIIFIVFIYVEGAIVKISIELENDSLINFATTVSHKKIIDTLNWKTYRNTINGFEFAYPGDWIIERASDKEIKLKSKDASYTDKYTGGDFPSSIKVTGITMEFYFDVKPSKQLFEIKQNQQSLSRVILDSKIAGQDGFIVQFGVDSPDFDKFNETAYFAMPNGGIVSAMVEMPMTKKQQYVNVFKQILSTFKFYNPEDLKYPELN